MDPSQAEVTFSITKTKNLGNYESVRIQVGLSVTCEKNSSAIKSTYEKIRKFVLNRLDEEETAWDD